MGLMSTTAARWMVQESIDGLSYGYDKVRFTRPVRFGDTVTVSYAKDSESDDGSRVYAKV